MRLRKCLFVLALLALLPGMRGARAMSEEGTPGKITLFLSGDVMTGRGIDQALPHPVDPVLYEDYIIDARLYLGLAQRRSGPIPVPVSYEYLWGDSLDVLAHARPDLRIINLETSITAGGEAWPRKPVHYRMHPKNIAALNALGVDCAVLANNHMLDWGYEGLDDTLKALAEAGIKSAGAGEDISSATAPAIMEARGGGRVLVFSYGHPSSGIPSQWGATKDRAGVNLLPDLSADTAASIAARVEKYARESDIVIASIHWGDNWGYDVPDGQVAFAHMLIDRAGVDVVYGHSSHHPRPLEVYKGRLVLYGAGDFFNDYEGISGHEEFRPKLSLMYLPTLDTATGKLVELRMVPMRIERFRMNRATAEESRWLKDTLSRESAAFGTKIILTEDDVIVLT
jgi:poly-gamma-glutamate capsule biosynthesis protein CapA/YwtB (metallophosphatase superfamily)